MLEFLNTLKEQHRDDDNTLIAINEIENEINGKKYGLVWEEHEEDVDVKMRNHIPVFTEEKDKEITRIPGGDYNFLIEGDNLHSLKLLEKTHRGKIDVIYIDPPYNTGNAFKYADDNVDLDDKFRHSKWLSFIQSRLKIAYTLLSEEGIIFISIDDNEQADLKLLCDEVFGEKNFFTQIIVQSNKRGQTYKQIAKTHEYILVYTKTEDAEFNEIEKTDDDNDLTLLDNISNYNIRELRNRNPKFGRFNRPNLFYPFYVNPSIVDKDGFSPVSLKKNDEYWIEACPYNSKGVESCWRWGKTLSELNINSDTQISNLVARKKNDGNYNIYEKYRKTTYKAKSIWAETEMTTEHGTVQLGEMGLADKFDFPKPVELISKCLQIGSNPDSIILDFFAGSGTTGQAVMELNKKDNGKRRFILCTNNENKICEEATYNRLKCVINGYEYKGKNIDILFQKKIGVRELKHIDEYLEEINKLKKEHSQDDGKLKLSFNDNVLMLALESQKNCKKYPIDCNLKYYRTDFIPYENENISESLNSHIVEMIEIEHGINIDGHNYIMILDDDEADEVACNWNDYSNIKAIYISNEVLLTTEQTELFKGIPIYNIPDCYFNFELREAGEIW